MSEVSQAALEAAMRAAVSSEMIAKHADEATYLRNWEGMKAVLAAAQATEPLCRSAEHSKGELPETDSEVRMRLVLTNVYENLSRSGNKQIDQCIEIIAAALRQHMRDRVHNDFCVMDAMTPNGGQMLDEAIEVHADWCGADQKRGMKFIREAFVDGYVECFKVHRRDIKAGMLAARQAPTDAI